MVLLLSGFLTFSLSINSEAVYPTAFVLDYFVALTKSYKKALKKKDVECTSAELC